VSDERGLALIVQSGSHNRLHAMVSLTATAVSLGRPVFLLLTHEALKRYLEDSLDLAEDDFMDEEYRRFYQDAVEDERTPNLRNLLEQAITKGSVQVFGCQASVLLWRAYTPEQLGRLTAVIGHATFLNLARDMQLLFL